jgi:hypothetical protein
MVFWGYTYVTSMQLNRPLWNKESLSPLENPKWQEILLSKSNSILRSKQCARCYFFYHRWFSFERYMCFFNSAE